MTVPGIPEIDDMAVPKRKTSKSKRNMRRSHHALTPAQVIVDKETGEYRLPHHMDSFNGSYKGRTVVEPKQQDDFVDETEAETL